jgi:hypothetical protein
LAPCAEGARAGCRGAAAPLSARLARARARARAGQVEIAGDNEALAALQAHVAAAGLPGVDALARALVDALWSVLAARE